MLLIVACWPPWFVGEDDEEAVMVSPQLPLIPLAPPSQRMRAKSSMDISRNEDAVVLTALSLILRSASSSCAREIRVHWCYCFVHCWVATLVVAANFFFPSLFWVLLNLVQFQLISFSFRNLNFDELVGCDDIYSASNASSAIKK